MSDMRVCEDERPNHGPLTGNRWCSIRPPYGSIGNAPNNIYPDEYCGVRRNQLPYWWTPHDLDRSISGFSARCKHWASRGWYFVVYTMPEDKCREDNGQIIFLRDEYLKRSLYRWDRVPLPILDTSEISKFHSLY